MRPFDCTALSIAPPNEILANSLQMSNIFFIFSSLYLIWAANSFHINYLSYSIYIISYYYSNKQIVLFNPLSELVGNI